MKHNWLMYLVLVIAATSTPGPAVIFAMTNATLHGLRKATFAAFGNITGLLVMGLVAMSGLGALPSASEAAFSLIKYAGSTYLVYLGIRLFFQKGIDLNRIQGEFNPGEKSAVKIYLQAIGRALSNPKAIIFLTALFPQFIVVDAPVLPQFSALMATLMFFSFVFLFLYALLASRAKFWLLKPTRMKMFGRVSGTVFVGFGALLATSHR